MSNPKVSVVTTVFNRKDELPDTIKSVKQQTYRNIEYIVIDGGSTDGTKDVAREYADTITTYDSRPDLGIYDGMNRGIDMATGDYICHIHAGDTYTLDFIEKAVALAEADKAPSIVYSGYRHGGEPVTLGKMSAGFLLHHLGISHLTFLIPTEVYRNLGGYDVNTKIVSDHMWVRQAFLKGIKFIRLADHVLNFAPAGASDGSNEKQRNLIIAENIAAFRAVFSFLPIDVAESLYLYRFKEDKLLQICDFVKVLNSDDGKIAKVDDRVTLFKEALTKFLIYMWSTRDLDTQTSQIAKDAAAIRVNLSELLDIPISKTNIHIGPSYLGKIVANVDAFVKRFTNKRIVLHFAEVFSRPSETFILNFIAERRKDDEDVMHILICDKRVLLKERPLEATFQFDYALFPKFFSDYVMDRIFEKFAPELMVYHFIRNGWHFLHRIDSKYSAIPSVFMAHGVDVFSLKEESQYSDWVKQVASKLPNAHFTAVSEYLKGELIDQGVSPEKITLMHNSISNVFWDNRKPGVDKTADREKSGYDLRLLNIGRLVDWKGHEDIIRALHRIVEHRKLKLKLTVVYGSDATNLEFCKQLASDLGFSDNIEFIETIDLDRNPKFLHDFDMFVSGSKYTFDYRKQSETFGVAILEAIASGLPVVVTDAGGQPEVSGPDNEFVRIAKHTNAIDISDKILELYDLGSIAKDNRTFAQARIDHFSTKKQADIWRGVVKSAQKQSLSTLLISTNLNKGAGGAALRVHKALLEAGVNSTMLCKNPPENPKRLPAVVVNRSDPKYLIDDLHPAGRFFRKNHTIFSIDTDGIDNTELLSLASDVDVINLHWHARFLSNDNIARLTWLGKPVVFTIRDMYPMSGGCHFFHGCENYKYQCFPCPQFIPVDLAIPRRTLDWKMANFNFNNIFVVALSDTTKRQLSESSMFRDVPIFKIPNPVDLETFRPINKVDACKELGIGLEKKIIAYLPSFSSSVKGWTEFAKAIQLISKESSHDVQILTAGVREKHDPFLVDTLELGYIKDKQKLAYFYSAADVTVISSLEETFSNTGVESLACGTPICTFKTGALPEMAQDGRGFAVKTGDSVALARAVLDALDFSPKSREICRKYAEVTYSSERIGSLYKDLFLELAHANRLRRRKEKTTHTLPMNTASYIGARWITDIKNNR